jgi:hypothetical protein
MAYARKRTGSASASSGDSNQTIRRATVSVSEFSGIDLIEQALG